ncbi:uncharacterized protein MONBRDRAFT_36697 [Monosiga brevicollis MX1]|uniref:CCDC113/CCDC96 coiled-coil domain-containing protein n=1 Tax=Monosiga brevicollis TaxID=81824 RepID=A9UWY1_MONBE|nr:uncharacterized protein MONBRDRAFT_36697 [Monosiga brevicollis MX1]EDQ90120.1 predicted protein [Monosiga brevicollis MX1]|eukprot:XP_001744887.1 hypothetical protein [Monosiga brevicollis MX1]
MAENTDNAEEAAVAAAPELERQSDGSGEADDASDPEASTAVTIGVEEASEDAGVVEAGGEVQSELPAPETEAQPDEGAQPDDLEAQHDNIEAQSDTADAAPSGDDAAAAESEHADAESAQNTQDAAAETQMPNNQEDPVSLQAQLDRLQPLAEALRTAAAAAATPSDEAPAADAAAETAVDGNETGPTPSEELDPTEKSDTEAAPAAGSAETEALSSIAIPDDLPQDPTELLALYDELLARHATAMEAQASGLDAGEASAPEESSQTGEVDQLVPATETDHAETDEQTTEEGTEPEIETLPPPNLEGLDDDARAIALLDHELLLARRTAEAEAHKAAQNPAAGEERTEAEGTEVDPSPLDEARARIEALEAQRADLLEEQAARAEAEAAAEAARVEAEAEAAQRMAAERAHRRQLIEEYSRLSSALNNAEMNNGIMHANLAEYLHSKRTNNDQGKKTSSAEAKHQYQLLLERLVAMDRARADRMQHQDESTNHLVHAIASSREQVERLKSQYTKLRRRVALSSISRQSGMRMRSDQLEELEQAWESQQTVLSRQRRIYSRAMSGLESVSHRSEAHDQRSGGLSLIDFEQLKIENQTRTEQIEERTDEVINLKRRVATTVQILSHVTEKLHFLREEAQIHRGKLREEDANLARRRAELSRLKKVRDQLANQTQRLRQELTLLHREDLQRDFEGKEDERALLTERAEELQSLHGTIREQTFQLTQRLPPTSAVTEKKEHAASARPFNTVNIEFG